VRIVARDGEVVVLGGGGVAAQNYPAITEEADAEGKCFAAADRRLGHSSGAKAAVERAVRIVAGEHESIAATSIVGAAHQNLAVGLQRRGGRDSPGAFDLAADAEALIKASIRVEADERKIIERAVRAGASKPDYNDFSIGLQNHIVTLGRGIAKSRLHAAVAAERLIEAAVGIITGGDE